MERKIKVVIDMLDDCNNLIATGRGENWKEAVKDLGIDLNLQTIIREKKGE